MSAYKKIEQVVGYWPKIGPLYPFMLTNAAFQRVQELSTTSVVPPWTASLTTTHGYVNIVTTEPEWFVNLEEQIRKLRTGEIK